MRKLTTLVFILSITFAYAQSTSQPFVMTAKDSILAKAWKVKQYDRFSVITEPSGREANDGLTFMADQTAFVTIDGNAMNGTWTTDKAKTQIMVTVDETKEQLRFRIVKLDPNEMVLKYQDKELMTTIYTYIPQK